MFHIHCWKSVQFNEASLHYSFPNPSPMQVPHFFTYHDKIPLSAKDNSWLSYLQINLKKGTWQNNIHKCQWHSQNERVKRQGPEPGCWTAVFIKATVCWGCSFLQAQQNWFRSLSFTGFIWNDPRVLCVVDSAFLHPSSMDSRLQKMSHPRL